ncbi:MAG: Rrf2 family transcriptional regulator [Gimesia sp.]
MSSQSVDYALRAVVTIAQQAGRVCPSREIAKITQVPPAYLSKLLQVLVHGGLVHSQRGLHGGYLLTKEPKEMTVLDIVNVVEPIKQTEKYPLKIKVHHPTLCRLHLFLDNTAASNESMFRETTIADLLVQPDPSAPFA